MGAPPSKYLLQIFTCGLLAHSVVSNQLNASVEMEITQHELMEKFNKWQLKIAMAELHLKSDLRLKPLVLFDFPANECAESLAPRAWV